MSAIVVEDGMPEVARPIWSARRRWFVLFMLVVAGIFNNVDRQIVSVLLEPIKGELGASDTQMGLLTGIYFSAFYVLAGVPLARLADTRDRRTIIASCIALWSVATVCCGLARGYFQLAFARMFTAIGEGGSAPASYSVLADVFPLGMRARAFGLFTLSSAIGLPMGIFFAGTLNEALGWRNVFIALGAPGIVFALLFYLTVPEPERRHPVVGKREPMLGALAGFWKIPTYRWVMVAAFGTAVSGYATLAWLPAFLIRVHGLSTAEVGVQMGLATLIGLVLGNVLSGVIADHMAKRSPKWILLITGFALMACLPLMLVTAFAPGVLVVLLSFTLFKFCAAFMPPCTQTAVFGIVEGRSRALASSSVPVFINLGAALGPFFVGAATDLLAGEHGGILAIRVGLGASGVFAAIGGIACFIGARTLGQDYKESE